MSAEHLFDQMQDGSAFDAEVADLMVALWVSQYDRPLGVPKHDLLLQDIIQYCLRAPVDTTYTLPGPDKGRDILQRLGLSGRDVCGDFVLNLQKDGLKPCSAGDIWSDKDVSLLG